MGLGFTLFLLCVKMRRCFPNGVVKGDVPYGLQNLTRRTARAKNKTAGEGILRF